MDVSDTIRGDSAKAIRTLLRIVRRILVALAAAIMFWTILIMLFENSFIFFPSPYPSGPYDDIRTIPNATEHTFLTEDGVQLHGVFAPVDSPQATILFAHGNAGNLSHRFHWLKRMAPLRTSIFMFDYRGYGKSEGSPDEDGIYADARAAYDLLMSLDTTGIPVVLWGRSLGGAVVVDLATHRRTDGLILESTFTSARDMASSAYPFLPGVGSLISTRLDSRSKITNLSIPSLHVHGSADNIVPVQLGKELFLAASGPKDLLIVDGAGHNDTYIVGGEAYLERIGGFLRSLRSTP